MTAPARGRWPRYWTRARPVDLLGCDPATPLPHGSVSQRRRLIVVQSLGLPAARPAWSHALDSLSVPPPPTPTACLGLEQDVQTLVNQAQALRNDALNAVGIVAWQKLSELGLKLLELDRKRAEYQKCVDAHTGTLIVGFSTIDAGGGGATDDRRADLWDVSGPQPVLLESVPVSSGSFAFGGSIPSGAFAVAISGTDTATSTGPDFRSGPITTAATGTPNVEIVLGPIVHTIAAGPRRRHRCCRHPVDCRRARAAGAPGDRRRDLKWLDDCHRICHFAALGDGDFRTRADNESQPAAAGRAHPRRAASRRSLRAICGVR